MRSLVFTAGHNDNGADDPSQQSFQHKSYIPLNHMHNGITDDSMMYNIISITHNPNEVISTRKCTASYWKLRTGIVCIRYKNLYMKSRQINVISPSTIGHMVRYIPV